MSIQSLSQRTPVTPGERLEGETLIYALKEHQCLPTEELKRLISLLLTGDQWDDLLFSLARQVTENRFGKQVRIRGLIEFTNYCKNSCYYCGIQRDNSQVTRYRLSVEQILDCCRQGYEAGFRTFVLQGGEDPFLTEERAIRLITAIKTSFPHCILTLSMGEWPKESYEAFYQAGADRYLLRHETADHQHYAKLHPVSMRLERRMRCLYELKEIGFQTGAGFMVGSPFQTIETVVKDLLFLKELKPYMAGIGPFIPHRDTPFSDRPAGDLKQTLRILAVVRLMHPDVLLPATTALGSIHPQGCQLGLMAGANVVMPNLSPQAVRNQYTLYDNKLSTGGEAAEGIQLLNAQLAAVDRYISYATEI